MPRLLKRLLKIISPMLAMLLFLLPASGIAGGAGGKMPVPVQVADIQRISLAPSMWITGTIISRHDASLAAEVEGRVESVLEVGEVVSQGEVIARIDDFKPRMALDEAKGNLAMVESKLDFFKRESVRLQQLSLGDNVAKNSLDAVLDDRDQALSELAVQQARLTQAVDTLKRTVIVSPFAGVVAERFTVQGEWAKIGDPLVRLVDTESTEIQARVPQRSVPFIEQGSLVEVTDGVVKTESTVRSLIPFNDNPSRLYEIRLDFVEPQWKPGHAVRLRVPVKRSSDALVIAHDALVIRGDTINIFRITKDNVAEAVAVKTGVISGDLVEVIGDVNIGDRIVIRGNERLKPQQQISVQEGR